MGIYLRPTLNHSVIKSYKSYNVILFTLLLGPSHFLHQLHCGRAAEGTQNISKVEGVYRVVPLKVINGKRKLPTYDQPNNNQEPKLINRHQPHILLFSLDQIGLHDWELGQTYAQYLWLINPKPVNQENIYFKR